MKTLKKSVLASLVTAGFLFGMPLSAATTTASATTQQSIQEFKYDMKTKLNEMDAKLERLQNKITKEASENRKEANIAMQKRLNELKEVRVDIANKMDSLQESAADRYAELRSSIETSYGNLKTELERSLN